MSERGVFAVDRGIFDHPIFAPEPYTEREAWLWMLSAAVWADKRVRVGRAFVDLKRGQLAFALRFVAKKFQWTDSRVRRFLKRLESDAMVTVSATREATQVTICNYDKYAFGRRVSEASTDAQTDGRATDERRKEEEPKNSRKKDSEAKASGADAPLEDPSQPERDYFARGRDILGKSAGGQLAKLLKLNGGNVALSRSTLELAATKHDKGAFFARAIAHQSQGPPVGKGGFTAVLFDKHMERQNGTSDSEPEFSEH
jgi:hypothetical protein